MGVGAAYSAILELLKNNERVSPRVTKLFFFVSDQSLNSCRSATDDSLPLWYYDHSSVFVAENHHIWDYTSAVNGAGARKPKKRFGTLIRSEYDALEDMLSENLGVVTGDMEELSKGWEEMVSDDDDHPVVPEEEEVVGTPEDQQIATTAEEPRSPDKKSSASPGRLPPIGNFALSPRKRVG